MTSVETRKGGASGRRLPVWPVRPSMPAARPAEDGPALFDVGPFDEALPDVILPLAPLLFRFHDDKEALALAAGVDVRSVQRWALSGVSWLLADWLSCRTLGENPMAVWGEQWDLPT